MDNDFDLDHFFINWTKFPNFKLGLSNITDILRAFPNKVVNCKINVFNEYNSNNVTFAQDNSLNVQLSDNLS